MRDFIKTVFEGMGFVGTSTTFASQVVISTAGAASTSPLLLSGSWYSGGSTSTTTPQIYIKASGAADPSFNTNGTAILFNGPSGWNGNYIECRTNGGSTIFSVAAGGGINCSGSIVGTSGGFFQWNGRTKMTSPSDGTVQLANNAGTGFTSLSLGPTIAAPSAVSLLAGSVVAGTTDTAGASFTIAGSQGTGTGAGGSIIFQTAAASTTGSTQNALVTALTIDSTKTCTFAGPAVHSVAGAASTPALLISGSWYTGGSTSTTTPQVYIKANGATDPSFNTSGSGLVINAANAFGGYIFVGAVNGSIVYVVNQQGGVSSSNYLQCGSGNYLGFNGRSRILSSSDGTFQLTNNAQTGFTNLQIGPTVAAPSAVSILAGSVVAGTSNTAGTNFIITGSQGTGTGVGGSIIFQVAPAGTTGTSQNALVTALTIDSTKLATFAGGINIMSGSLTVNASTFVTSALYLSVSGSATITSLFLHATNGTMLGSASAYNVRFGAADASAPNAQTLSVQNVVAGTSNTAGTNFTIAGSQGTGTGAGGSIIFQVAPAGTTGTAQNALATALTIDSTKGCTFTGVQTWNPASGIAGYIQAGAIEQAVYSNGNSGTSLALNLDNGNKQSVTITGAVTMTLSAPTHPGSFTLIITQDGTGHTYSFSGVKWAGGSQPTWSTAASAKDVVSLVYDGTNWYGSGSTAFA